MFAAKRNRLKFNWFWDYKIANIEELLAASPPVPLRGFHSEPCSKIYVTETPPKLGALDQPLPWNFKEDVLDCELLVSFLNVFVAHTEELSYF